MAKAPAPGVVKTRLTPPLTPAQSARLSTCFLRDTLENLEIVARSARASGVVAYTPIGQETAFHGMMPEGFSLLPQRGEDFGERLLSAAEDLLASGYASVCLIDSDSPTVPSAIYKQAVEELARPGDRIVLGPAIDGGYYLIGLKQAHPGIFQNIRWSTHTVADDTRQQAWDAGVEVVELPSWYDIDDAVALKLLQSELLEGVAPLFATMPGYPASHSRGFLSQHLLSLSPHPNTGSATVPSLGRESPRKSR